MIRASVFPLLDWDSDHKVHLVFGVCVSHAASAAPA